MTTTAEVFQKRITAAEQQLAQFHADLLTKGFAYVLGWQAAEVMKIDHLRIKLQQAVTALTAPDTKCTPDIVIKHLRDECTRFLLGCRWEACSTSPASSMSSAAEALAYKEILDRVLPEAEMRCTDNEVGRDANAQWAVEAARRAAATAALTESGRTVWLTLVGGRKVIVASTHPRNTVAKTLGVASWRDISVVQLGVAEIEAALSQPGTVFVQQADGAYLPRDLGTPVRTAEVA